ncbi:alpha/beta hydrolase [Actinospica durhamensis]|uniref:Alpha/beta hydrolase n=1 Tax=Actinospica durhamensis TaxID=1508375 RepID=A0A941EK54_9ACTN|nr:alpha/beta hydrolase [Actinospica durhamensis]MBR7832686.1 alpha/beta hydrolase [Actinospica durhamensis]
MSRFRSSLLRLVRQCVVAFAVMALSFTCFGFVYNLATEGAVPAPAGLTYVQTGDISTRYREWGASGSPVLLLHGFVESADTWQDTAALLARDHRVYAIDLDGFGYSSRVAPYTTAHLTAQVEEFIAAMHLVRPLLVGHSSGAAVAAAVALAEPSNVGGVLFLDGDGLPLSGTADEGRSTGGFGISLPQPYRTTLLRLVLRSDSAIRLIYAETCGPRCPALSEAGIDQWRRPFQVAGAEPAAFDVLNAGIPSLPVASLARLAELPFPKAVVYGADDPEYAPGSAAETAARIGAPAPTLIPDARHLTLISDPAVVAAAVERLAARAEALAAPSTGAASTPSPTASATVSTP